MMNNTNTKPFLRPVLYLLLALWGTTLLTACGGNNEPPASPTTAPASGYPVAAPDQTSAYPVGTVDTAAALTPTTAVDTDYLFFTPPPQGLPTFPGKIAYHSEMYGKMSVVMMDGTTGTITRLTNDPSATFEPNWSPDCSEFAYTREVGDNDNFEVLIQNMASGQSRLFAAQPGVYHWGAAWSPTGQVIAYQQNPNARMNICFQTPDGQDLGCMAGGDFSNAMPTWSPDGTQLAFGSNREGNWELYVTDYPAMSTLTRLTNNTDIDFHPAWSPNGEWLVYSSKRTGAHELYKIRPNGQEEQQLTSLAIDARNPAWIGNDLIAFGAYLNEDWELYLLDVNGIGNDWQRLTYSPKIDQWAAWCPAN